MIRVLFLLLSAQIIFVGYQFLPLVDYFHLGSKGLFAWPFALFLLPLGLACVPAIEFFIDPQMKKNYLRPTLYFLILLGLSGQPVFYFCLAILIILHFYILKKISKKLGFLFLLVISIFIVVESYRHLQSLENLSTLYKWGLITLKSCLLLRLIAWTIEQTFYRDKYSSLSDFLEFIFFPAFFIYPGQIQYFQHNYFLESRTKEFHWKKGLQSLGLILWGLLLSTLFANGDHLFWSYRPQIPFWIDRYGFGITQMSIGFFWLFLVYLQQCAGMSLQVGLSRLMGYQIKYDMHWPLLTRTPLEYLRNHSSYVKDYILNIGFKPLAVWATRQGWASKTLYLFLAFLSYSVLIGMQTGLRPDYNRSLMVTLALMGFMIFFIIYELTLIRCLPSLLSSDQFSTDWSSQNTWAKIKKWHKIDYLLWIINILILSLYKAALGLALGFKI